MLPPVRWYRDPYEGLKAQLLELRGLIKIVPPLIQADRQRRWDEAGRAAGPDDELIYIFESEAGEEEGFGFADYARTLYSTAIVTAWDIFHVYLARLLDESCLQYDLENHPGLAKLVAEERRTWDRRFDRLETRYNDFASVDLKKLETWKGVSHAKELRNALVHNLGQYTTRYLTLKDARRPTANDDAYLGITVPETDEELLEGHLIPLDLEFSDGIIAALLEAGEAVKRCLTQADYEGSQRAET